MQTGDRLVAAGFELDRLGLAPAGSGNLSVVDGDNLLISPSGESLGRLGETGISIVTRDGAPIAGPRASKELSLHMAMLERVQGSRAVVHLHSPAAVAISCLPPWSRHSAIAPLTPYFVMRVGRVPLVPYARPGSQAMADALRALPHAPFRAALLQNHGSIVAGTDLSAAVDAALEFEATARVQLLAGAEAIPLGADRIGELVEEFGALW